MAEYCRMNGIVAGAFYHARSRFGLTRKSADPQAGLVSEAQMTETELVPKESDAAVFCEVKVSVPAISAQRDSSTEELVRFATTQIEEPYTDGYPIIIPGRRPPDTEPLDFYFNGIRLTFPAMVSESTLLRVMKACCSL